MVKGRGNIKLPAFVFYQETVPVVIVDVIPVQYFQTGKFVQCQYFERVNINRPVKEPGQVKKLAARKPVPFIGQVNFR